MKQKIYIASGWFSEIQIIRLEEIEKTLSRLDFDIYSPRKESIYKPGDDPSTIAKSNIDAINNCDLIIASTEGKDMGTLWEVGYAYAKEIPIIYYYISTGVFNIMLASTGSVVSSIPELAKVLKHYKNTYSILPVDYKGEME